VDLEHLGLARKLDPNNLRHRHETLAERVELLARVPDLADPEITVRTERDVVLEPSGSQSPDSFRRRTVSSY
jgi:hypothetical protein